MHATGLFFLRSAPDKRALADGTHAEIRLHVVERDPADHRTVLNMLTAIWRGAPAFEFERAHGAELRPGRGLLLTLDRLRVDPVAGPVGEITHCDIAPPAPSWIAGSASPAEASDA